MKSDPEKGSMKPAPLLFSCRLTLFIVFLFTTYSFLLQRINISFALVCMVKRPNLTTIDSDLITTSFGSNVSETDIFESVFTNATGVEDEIILGLSRKDALCKSLADSKMLNSSTASLSTDNGEFEWSKDVQGAILASFFYGYLFTQISGGWLAQRFGAKLALLASSASLSVLTLASPIAAKFGPEYLFGVRLLQGITHGASLPAMSIFAARWCAPQERGFLMGIGYGGFGIAAASTFPICAFLCENFGWESIFYATGGFGLILLIVSHFLVYEWPENHPRISQHELEFLRKTRSVSYSSSQKSKKIQVPWRSIITSGPVNVVHITHTCFTWGFLMIGMYMPTYLKEVLYMDTNQNGIYASLPYAGMLVLHFLVGSIFDFFRRKNYCSVTVLRKIFNTVGMIGPAVALIVTGFLNCTNIEFGIAMVTIGQSLAEFAFMGGYLLSIYEISPQYAGIIIGVTNTFGVLPGFLCPLLVSLLTPNGTREEWIVVFVIAAGINVFGAVLYGIFGSCELQPWAINTERRESSLTTGRTLKRDRDSLHSETNGGTGNPFLEHEMVPLNTSHSMSKS